MKKIMAVLLALCAVLTLLAGCGGGSGGGSGDSRVINDHGNGESQVASPTLIPGAESLEGDLSSHWLCDEKTTLKILTYDGVNSSYRPPSNDLWFWQLMEEYTNVHIDWEISPMSGYGEVLNTRLSAGVDLADIVMSTNNRATTNAGNNGVFIDLMPYWDSCFTNTKSYMEQCGIDLLSYITNPNGKVYALPKGISRSSTTHCGWRSWGRRCPPRWTSSRIFFTR